MESLSGGRKRPRSENDLDTPSRESPRQPSHKTATSNSMNRSDMSEQGEWQVATSRRRKKRKIQKEESNPDYPALRLSNQMPATLRVKDLQDLVLYVLADGVAPTWIAVNKAKDIRKVVVLMVPGIDRNALESLRRISTNPPFQPTGMSSIQESASSLFPNPRMPANEDNQPATDPQSVPLEYIVSVKAPGDSRNAKVHSPLQGMLVSPHTASNIPQPHQFQNGANFQFVRTPISSFIHTADELVEAEYPVHEAAFTAMADAELEKERRNKAGQSPAAGWVDTKVSSSTPVKPDGVQNTALDEGLTIYAIDCEMVQTEDDVFSLARISIVDWGGKVVMDRYVKPDLPVKNYFTEFSGITPQILQDISTTLADIQTDLLSLFTASTVLLGHSLESDLNALKLTHPFIIDTAIVYPHPRGFPLRSSLKFLSNKYLKREIQMGGVKGHDSVEDARAVLDLVKLKCERGPRFGTMDQNGESLFRRLQRSGKTSAIVEYGTPERGLGKEATHAIGCQDDDEIVQGIHRALSGDGDNGSIPNGGVDFTWSRLRAIEFANGWTNRPLDVDKSKEKPSTELEVSNGKSAGHAGNGEESIVQESDKAVNDTVRHIQQIFDSLPSGTLFVLYHGNGDMQPVLRLQAIQKQFKKEFKVKKWDELSVKWTDTEEQALRNAVDDARKGAGLVCIK